MRRSGLAVIAALFVSGCAARDPIVSPSLGTVSSGNWKIERQTDRTTGAPIASAYISNGSTSHSDVLFQKKAGLGVSCFHGEAIVRMVFPFKVGSTRNSQLSYRFDDKQGRETEARITTDYTTLVIEDPDEVYRFTEEMRSARSLTILIRSLNMGRTSADFDVTGAAEAIDTALATCRPKPPAPPEPPKRKRKR